MISITGVREFRYVLKSTQGSISIYFMIIFSVVFLFNTVLIDFARIKLADLQAEKLMRSSIRSALSSYDSSLQSYGLYAITSEENAQQIFQDVYVQNLLQNNNDYITNLSTLVLNEDAVQVSSIHTLANENIFEQQILEEMKYRAPIEFVLSVIDPFQSNGLAGDLKNTSSFSKLSKDIEKLIQEREKYLDLTWSQIQLMLGISGTVRSYYHYYDQQYTKINTLAEGIGIKQMDTIRQDLNEMKQDINNYRNKIDNLEEKLEQSATAQEKTNLLSRINKYNQSIKELKKNISDLEGLIDKIIKYSETVLITDLKMEDDYNQLLTVQNAINSYLKKALDVNDKITEKTEKNNILGEEYIVIYDLTYFRKMESEIGTIISLFSGMKSQFDPVELLTGTDYIKRHQNLVDANEQMFQHGVNFYNKQNGIESQRMNINKNLHDQKETQRQKTENQLKQVISLSHSCNGTEQPLYIQLGDFKNKYDLFNEKSQSKMLNKPMNLTDADNVGKQAMSIIDNISASLLSVRDEAFVNEYALSKFNYRTLEKSTELSDPQRHSLHNQEVEYILYGFNNCELNQTSAFSEMFLLRLAIRTMEALSDPEQSIVRLGSPLLSFLWAIAEGSKEAYNDMQKLVAGEEVNLSDKLSKVIHLDYKDYLRVFLFLHSNDSNMMSRMLALIELNTGQNLVLKPVAIEASVETSMRLWFIPNVMELLRHEVRGNQVIMNKTISLSY
ncbi:hypothetical protein [Chengkuizengella axinellae]|uniref:Flp pilus-assembly TadG-like N-terminal domain-containing protein n=1 Tax=Chengkuizengella axinellae TaxID=3064388 RepID=A0ABT9IXP2_9BACL|nr:hypothetical protein [Chengkuizengella sp. 2205SS18-9]MDP5274100.1 hypothetical protein [Chengkuizengella sp. 2205SS18-9]